MRNKFLKGLSVAFAAAMAFTVVAPALTTEAASSKAYVVSEKVSKNDDGETEVTKYTYDSRGRVTKKVVTNTSGTEKYVESTRGDVDTVNRVQTTVKIDTGSGYKDYTDTTVVATTYKNETATVAADAKTVATTTYTYYNSGAKKDQKKSESTTTEAYYIKGVESSNSDNSYGYYWFVNSTEDVEFTYDGKGNLVKDVTTTTVPGKTYGLVVAGAGWDEDAVKAMNATESHNKTITVDTKNYTVNSKGQTTRVDRVIEGGQRIELWKLDNSEKDDTRTIEVGGQELRNGDYLQKYEGIYATWKYNKNGFPTEYVAVNGNKVSKGTADNGYQTFNDTADSVTTYKYTYGKDLQLQKKVETGKNPAYGNGTEGTITTDVTNYKYKEDGSLDFEATFNASTRSTVTAPIYGNDYTTTVTYHYELKNGSTAKTFEAATATTVENGVTDKTYNDWTVSYKLKKISVPSSRLQDVVLDQAKAQTDFDW